MTRNYCPSVARDLLVILNSFQNLRDFSTKVEMTTYNFNNQIVALNRGRPVKRIHPLSVS